MTELFLTEENWGEYKNTKMKSHVNRMLRGHGDALLNGELAALLPKSCQGPISRGSVFV